MKNGYFLLQRQKSLPTGRCWLLSFLLIFLPFSSLLYGQKGDPVLQISGTVTDEANMPLIGVSILEVGTSNGTATDIDGNYKMTLSGKGTLRFSYLGYVNVDKSVSAAGIVNIIMREDNQLIDEIVVVGYGTQRKQDLTGAIAVVDMKEAQKLTAGSVSEFLQGQVAGVSVQSSGDPGSMGKISIRGVGSFSDVGPLYVVDGLIVNDMNHINPADIESMQVLKDASSTAIYGSRGANGVIIVATKKGKAGKPSLNITGTFGVQQIGKKIQMKNTIDFLHYNELAYINAGEAWPSKAKAGMYLPNSDYQDAIFQTGFVHDYNLSYSQGTDKTSMMIGGGYFQQDGVLKGPSYQRLTFRINTEGRFGIFKIGENLSLSYANSKETNIGASSFTNALMMPPVIPIYDPSESRGGFGHGTVEYPTYSSNPVAIQANDDNRAINSRVIGNIYAELQPWKFLTYKLNMGVDFWYGNRKEIDHAYTIRMGSAQTKYNDRLNEIRDQRLSLIMEHTLTYNQKFGKHNIEALAGFTFQNDLWNYLRAEGYNQKVPGLWQIDLVGTQNNMWGSQQEHRMVSYLGRINYNYDDRYLVQFNFRTDGSSKFGPANRRGYFPSGSLGWRIGNESFCEPAKDWLDDLKLRVSYGIIGDMQALGNYDYIPGIDNSGPYEGFYAIFGPNGSEKVLNGALQSGSVNTGLGWETKATFNVGVDFAFLRNRLYGTIEYFNSISSDLLVNLPQAWANGVDLKWTNYGKMSNEGVEISLGWRDQLESGFSYSLSANLTTIKNTVINLGESYREGGWSQVNRTEQGRSVGDFFLIQSDGIFQNMDEVFAHTTKLADGSTVLVQPKAQPGDVRYVDHNEDGKIDLNDRQWMGSPLPMLQGGLNFSCGWKGIDFTMFWTATFGNKIFNVQRHDLLNLNVDNSPLDVNPWTWDHPSNIYPRPYSSSTDNTLGQTDRFLEDGSYLRLKNLQIGYSFPQAWMKKISVEKLRIYLSGQNLFTITSYKGYDPEIVSTSVFGQGNDNGGYPPIRSFNVGLQLSF